MRILPLAIVLISFAALALPIPARPRQTSDTNPAANADDAAAPPRVGSLAEPGKSWRPLSTGVPVRSGPFQVSLVATYRATATRMLAAGCPYATWAAQGRHFLFFDPAGHGRAAEVLGDLGTATRVAVLIPGVDTTLTDFDRGLGGVPRRAPGVQARALHDLLAKRDPHTAVIAWLGYDAPDGIGLAAATEGRARDGAAALTTFVRDLLPEKHVTLIGHSYGSIVAGLAAKDLPEVADVVTLGAPGIGVDRAGELGGARVWSALAPTDWIRRIPQVRVLGLGLGRRPTSPDFGAYALPTDGVAGHDCYLVPGSSTLRAVAGVVLSGGPRHDLPGRVS
ncbi:alpha/beta hydrolase [Paractinoplanes hotanensis]|uniref:Alpha/beta hydrolase family protein n=1 Tax=Paractinoplanes hotanensis TaxID=2906497 RepID=A0ABT0Y5V8_9ACTN|nr:alpha/beta hydrolase [Actinoplanes hotanensis]MCM4081415.1 alpha/beta hydrolase family protein [Actinoplanes hotanensis]